MEAMVVVKTKYPFKLINYLNIILIQSLTKFAQLGLDKLSAGLVILINNGQDWNCVN